MKLTKRLLSLILCLSIITSMYVPSFAIEKDEIQTFNEDGSYKIGYLNINSNIHINSIEAEVVVTDDNIYLNIMDYIDLSNGFPIEYTPTRTIPVFGAGGRRIVYDKGRERWRCITNPEINTYLTASSYSPIFLDDDDFTTMYFPIFPLLNVLGVTIIDSGHGLTFYIPQSSSDDLYNVVSNIMEPFGPMEVSFYSEEIDSNTKKEFGNALWNIVKTPFGLAADTFNVLTLDFDFSNTTENIGEVIDSSGEVISDVGGEIGNKIKDYQLIAGATADVFVNKKFGSVIMLNYEANISKDVLASSLGGKPTYEDSAVMKQWQDISMINSFMGSESFRNSDFGYAFFPPGSTSRTYITNANNFLDGYALNALSAGLDAYFDYISLVARATSISGEAMDAAYFVFGENGKHLIELDAYKDYFKDETSVKDLVEYTEEIMQTSKYAMELYDEYSNGINMEEVMVENALDVGISRVLKELAAMGITATTGITPETAKLILDIADVVIPSVGEDIKFNASNVKKEHYDLQKALALGVSNCLYNEDDFSTKIWYLYYAAKIYIGAKASYLNYSDVDMKIMSDEDYFSDSFFLSDIGNQIAVMNNKLSSIHPGDIIVAEPFTAYTSSDITGGNIEDILSYITYEKPEISVNNIDFMQLLYALIGGGNEILGLTVGDFDNDEIAELVVKANNKYDEEVTGTADPYYFLLDEDNLITYDFSSPSPAGDIDWYYSKDLNKIFVGIANASAGGGPIAYYTWTDYGEHDEGEWTKYATATRDKAEILDPTINGVSVSIDEWDNFTAGLSWKDLQNVDYSKVQSFEIGGEYEVLKEYVVDELIGETPTVFTEGDIDNDGYLDTVYYVYNMSPSKYDAYLKIPVESMQVQSGGSGYLLLVIVSQTESGAKISVVDTGMANFSIYEIESISIDDNKITIREFTNDYFAPDDMYIVNTYDLIINETNNLIELEKYVKVEPMSIERLAGDGNIRWEYDRIGEIPGSYYLKFDKNGNVNSTYFDYSQVIGADSSLVEWSGKGTVELGMCTYGYGVECDFKMSINPEYPVGPSSEMYDWYFSSAHVEQICSTDTYDGEKICLYGLYSSDN